MKARHRDWLRLVRACAAPGCPVCRCAAEDATRQLEALGPGVEDAASAWAALCALHGWMWAERTAGARPGDLLGPLIAELRRPRGPAAGGSLRALWRALAGGHARAELASCSVCDAARSSARRHLAMLVRSFGEPLLRRAYEASSGLCAPHLRHALAAGGDTRALLATTLALWGQLLHDLERGEDAHAGPAPEERAWALLFGDRMLGAGSVPTGEAAPPGPGAPDDGSEAPGEQAAFERQHLELRVQELTRQLTEASSRAAALHWRLAQVLEDRQVLEMNLSGERGAAALAERVIADLRAENARLRAELAALRPSGCAAPRPLDPSRPDP